MRTRNDIERYLCGVLQIKFGFHPMALNRDFRWPDMLTLEDQGWFLAELDAEFEGKLFNAFLSDCDIERIASVGALSSYIFERTDPPYFVRLAGNIAGQQQSGMIASQSDCSTKL